MLGHAARYKTVIVEFTWTAVIEKPDAFPHADIFLKAGIVLRSEPKKNIKLHLSVYKGNYR